MSFLKVYDNFRLEDWTPVEIERLENRVLTAILGRLVRDELPSSLSHTPLKEWQFWWEALSWSDVPETRVRLRDWLLEQGDCLMLAQLNRGFVWRVSAVNAKKLRALDTYLIPVNSPNICYITTHEEDFGPWILPLDIE